MTVRDWVLRFNAHGPDSLLDGKAPGQPSILSDEHRQRLSEMIESGPIPAVHGVVRWRLADLTQWLWEEYRIRISKQTLSRELRALNFRKLSARPRHHAKSDQAVAAFKLPRASGGDRAREGRRPARRDLVCRRGASGSGAAHDPQHRGICEPLRRTSSGRSASPPLPTGSRASWSNFRVFYCLFEDKFEWHPLSQRSPNTGQKLMEAISLLASGHQISRAFIRAGFANGHADRGRFRFTSDGGIFNHSGLLAMNIFSSWVRIDRASVAETGMSYLAGGVL
jgi:transposase